MAARALMLPALILGLAVAVAPPGVRRAEPEPVRVTGGEGFLAHQLIPLYLVPIGEAVGHEVPENLPLDPRYRRGTARTDAVGRLAPGVLRQVPPGLYMLVADYNADGFCTAGLDAVSFVRVAARDGGRPAVVLTLAASPRPARLGEPVTVRAVARRLDGRPFTSGVVWFVNDGVDYGAVPLDPDGTAALTIRDLPVGGLPIRAYALDAGADSAAAITPAVLANETALTLTVERAAGAYRRWPPATVSVTVTARTAPRTGGEAVRPNGLVLIESGGEVVESEAVGPDGRATVHLERLERGTWTVTARYGCDEAFAESLPSRPVMVTVRNNPPEALPIAVATVAGRPVRLTLWLQTNDEDGDPTTLARVSAPAHGTAAVVDGAMTYAPKPGFAGKDTFTYTVTDDHGGEGTARVTVRVYPPGGGSRVFADPDGDGAEGPADREARWILICAVDEAGKTVAEALTDANGFYELPTNIPAGTYRLRFDLGNSVRRVPFSPRGRGGKARGSDVDAAGLSDPVRFDPKTGWPAVNAGLVHDQADRAFDFLFE